MQIIWHTTRHKQATIPSELTTVLTCKLTTHSDWGRSNTEKVRQWIQIIKHHTVLSLSLSHTHTHRQGANGGTVGWGTVPQDRMSQVRFPVGSLKTFNWPNPSGCNHLHWGPLKLQQKRVLRNFLGTKVWPAHRSLVYRPPSITCYRKALNIYSSH